MKKVFKRLIVACSCMFTMFFILNASANSNVTVKVDDAVLNFDVQPEIINGRTMVPFRLIFEALGAKVSYNGETSEVTAERLWDGNPESVEKYKHVMPAYVKLKIGKKEMETVIDKKNQKVSLDVAPIVKDGRTLVPVRAISESFGADVYWDETTKTVDIFSNNFFLFKHCGVGGDSSREGHTFQVDNFNFYNGKLYFDFDMTPNNGIRRFNTKYIWDGSNTYSGKMTSFEDVFAIDKVDNRVVYFESLDDKQVDGGHWSTTEYYTADFTGENVEKLAIKKTFYNHDGGGRYLYGGITEYEIFNHPQWYYRTVDDGNKIEELTAPGTYTTEKDFLFAPRDSEAYVNSSEYREQCPAKIENNILYYKSALSEEILSMSIPVVSFDYNYAEIMLQTPRYIFVRTLSYDYATNWNTMYDYFTALYALDRFENKLITIKTLSSKGKDLSAEEFDGMPSDSSGGTSSGGGTSTGSGSKMCMVCSGTGSRTCTVCRGAGKVKSYIGYEHYKSCSGCSGRGSKRCTVCGGDGRVQD